MKHPFLFLKENKLWIAKGVLILFAFISAIVYFADFYHTIYVRFRSCTDIHPLLICIGLLSVTFTSCSLVIFLVQLHRHLRGKDYVHLELDGDDTATAPDMYEMDSSLMSSRLRNVLKWCSHGFTLLLSILLVAMMISYSSFEAKTLPKINGRLLMPGLISEATIEREPNGVLHIKASNLHDMYFAQGVAMAQERLWEMEFFRRVGSGTLSAVLGNGTLSTDIMFRTLGFWDASEAAVKLLSNESLRVVQAFTDGINSYLNTKPSLPAEFHLIGFEPAPFVPTDAMLMVKILGFELAGNMFSEIMYHELMTAKNLSFNRVCDLMPEYSATGPTILNDEDIAHINFTNQFDPINFSRTFTNKREQPEVTFTRPNEVPKIDVHDLIRQSGVLKGFNFGFKSASNNWVVSGNKTRSGKPLLCNDPHLTINAPSIWLMMHLESPNISLIGATPVGAPGITIGRNADIAWGVTNTFVDVQDLYILEMSEDRSTYFHNGNWNRFQVRSEIIDIKGLPPFNLQVYETLYGPVVSDVFDLQGKTAALRWTQLDDNDTTFEALQGLSVAKNFDDFRNALRDFVGPAQNFIYADTAGNIGYQCPGKVPARVQGHTGMVPVPGNGSYDWIGWIPYDELPYVLNPSKGYISSANNKIVPPSYPYLLLNNHDWDEHFRAQRIVDLINATTNHTIQTMMAMQMNTVTGIWKSFRPLIISLPDAVLDDRSHVWKYKLIDWDGNETAESQQATVFEYWVYYLGRLGSETGYYSWAFPYFILNTLANHTAAECQGDCVKFAASSFVQAVHAANNRKWGDVHHLIIEHPVMSQSPLACLFDREIKFGGSSFCVNVGAYSPRFQENSVNPFGTSLAASYRQIVDLSNMDNSQFVIPMGNSGNLLDSHYDNMLDSWLNGLYYPMKMSNYPVKHSLKLHKRLKWITLRLL